MRLQDDTRAPARPDRTRDFDTVFTTDKPVIFAYHGYPWLIHRLTYRRTNHDNLHVRGYKEEGTTTTPFDMVMMNDLDRYHLVMDVIDRVPGLGSRAASLRQEMVDTRRRARAWTREHGEDLPEVRDWSWAERRARTGTPRRRPPRRAPTERPTSERSAEQGARPAGRSPAPRRSAPPARSTGEASVLIRRGAVGLGRGCAPRRARSRARRGRRGASSRTRGDVLADPGGEDDGVGARRARRGRRRRTCGAGGSRRRTPSAPRSSPASIAPQQVAEVVTAGQPLQAGAVVQQVLEPVDVEVAVAQQVQQHAGVEVAGAGAHDQPLQRRQPHRRVHRAAAADRGRRGAVAEVQHDLVAARPRAGPGSRGRLARDVLRG